MLPQMIASDQEHEMPSHCWRDEVGSHESLLPYRGPLTRDCFPCDLQPVAHLATLHPLQFSPARDRRIYSDLAYLVSLLSRRSRCAAGWLPTHQNLLSPSPADRSQNRECQSHALTCLL